MTSEEIFACAREVGLIDKSESGDWFVRPDAEVKEVFEFANFISVVEGLIRSKTDETRAIVREKESDLNHKEIERLRDLSYDRLNKMNSLRVTNQMLKRIQKLTEAEKDKEIERLRDLVKAEREVKHEPHDTMRIAREAGFRIVPSRDGPDEVWGISDYFERFAPLVAAEKDKEIELLRADAKRLDWCISVLHRQDEKDSYLVTDTGCGCCGDGQHFDCSISGRDAIDAAIRARGE